MLISPYAGRLVNLLVSPDELEVPRRGETPLTAPPWTRGPIHVPEASLELSDRSVCDLELLANGGFSPLDRFMGQADCERVVREMRLADGTLWPIPITLPVAEPIAPGTRLALRDSRQRLLAVMEVEEAYPWDRDEMARQVLGTLDTRHPLVAEMASWGSWNLSGPLRVLQLPPHSDFPELRHTPARVRALLEERGRSNVVAFQTRNPLHRAHEELTRRAAEAVDGTLLLHPSVGMTRPGDVDHVTRVRCYRALARRSFEASRCLLSLLPLAMRMAGPREALWHAIIRRNYGANHFIVGRDHAGPGLDSQGRPFYSPYAAQELTLRHAEELGVTILPFQELVYLPEEDRFEQATAVPAGATVWSLSGTQVRDDYLKAGKPLPPWFTRPEVARVLAEEFESVRPVGFCLSLPSDHPDLLERITDELLAHGRSPISLADAEDEIEAWVERGLAVVTFCVSSAVANRLGPERFYPVSSTAAEELFERLRGNGLLA